MHETYKSKKVLVTGHTGFKGSWLSLWLNKIGAEVVGVSDRIPSAPSNFEVNQIYDLVKDVRLDLLDTDSILNLVREEKPDFIFHLAAQALVRPSYEDPLKTLKVNSIGTANLLNAIHMTDHAITAILITSDKVYDNVEWVWGYKESDTIGGKDPYSASKGMAELVIKTYFNSFLKQTSDKKIAICRAGNVIGGGDWAKDRIVPDCIRAWANKEKVEIRNPRATRPWQHVLEPLSGYLHTGAILSNDNSINGEAFNFGPNDEQNYSVGELVDEMQKSWENVKWINTNDQNKVYEASLLKLNCDKALSFLNWKPTLDFVDTVKYTVDWYRKYYEGEDIFYFTKEQIEDYEKKAQSRGIAWSKI